MTNSFEMGPRGFSTPLEGPERLVGVGFRCWIAGYQTGDIACWELAWDVYASELGPTAARAAMRDLSCWVRRIKDLAGREIVTFPAGCRAFCRDECVAVAMVAASQHGVCPALRACTYALLGCADIDGVVRETDALAATLAALDRRLSPASITLVGECLNGASAARH
jgi:hypothetical protein